MSDADILARFCALPDYVQRAIETELLDSRGAAPGSALDQVAQARLLAMIEREEKRVAATSEGTVRGGSPEIRANGRPTLPQDRSGAGGALPGHPRVSAATSASPSASWYPSDAPRSVTRPAAAPRSAALPDDLHAALAVAADHVDVAARMGASQEKCNTILRGYLTTLWKRPNTRATLERYEHLVALFDLRHGSGRR